MNLKSAILRFDLDKAVISGLFAAADDQQARWKPTPHDWSLLEVIAHLHDEEREDFRTRLDILLHRPEVPWPPIDPQGWVSERHYNERDPQQTLAAFLEERDRSLDWLNSLNSPDWSSSGSTPWDSTMSAAEMLHSWLAHDLLHIRQMCELQYKYLAAYSAPGSVEYAGDW
jgi:hypothetical protein